MVEGFPDEVTSFGQGLSPCDRPRWDMAAGAAKYAHCQWRPPVPYRMRTPFRPEIAAPYDFALRVGEVYAIDRELDRAVLRAGDLEKLLVESVASHPGPGGLFLVDHPASPDRRPFLPVGEGRAGALGPLRRQFAQNVLRFAAENSRFQPPWNEALVQDAHTLLLADLGLSPAPGELRSVPYVRTGPDGQVLYESCPPDRISPELGVLLDWIDRFGATYHPLVPAAVLLAGFHSLRPFPVGSMTVGRMLAVNYLQGAGLPNAGLVPIAGAVLEVPDLWLRLLLWTQATGSYSELVDVLLDRTLVAYESAAVRWLEPGSSEVRLEEVALRILTRARRSGGWFSGPDAARWVGGRTDATVLRHLNDLVRRGLLESLGQTRAKRYRLASPMKAMPDLVRRVAGRRVAARDDPEAPAAEPAPPLGER